MTGTVAITGAASGMGAATRTRLERTGVRVIGIDLAGVEINADLSTTSGRAQAIEDTLKRATDLQGVVICAGMGLPNTDPAKVVSVNFFGAVELLEGLRPQLVAGHGKAAVVTSGTVAVLPNLPEELIDVILSRDEARARELAVQSGDICAYACSKFALTRWVRRASATRDWAGSRVALNAVGPGATDTPMLAAAQGSGSAAMKEMTDQLPIPMRRVASADEMAALLEVLISPVADYMVGQTIYLDGGMEAALRAEHWPTIWLED